MTNASTLFSAARKWAVPRRLFPVLGLAWPMVSAPSALFAGPIDIAVRMQCPALSSIAAAEFEARAKVDLSARSPRGGELEVTCRDFAARIRWRPRGGEWSARSLAETATSAALVDGLLAASKELVEEAERAAKSASGEIQKPATPVETGAEREEAVETKDSAAPEEPDPTARKQDRATEQQRPRPSPRAETSSTDEPSRDRAAGPPGPPVEWAFGLSAGAQAALFDFNGTGIAGPNAGAFVRWGGWRASLSAAYDFAIGAGSVATVRVVSGEGLIAARLGPARVFELGVGALVGSLQVSSEQPFQPASQSHAFWGALVRARYAPQFQGWRLALGPDIRFYPFRPDVAVDGLTVWGIPVVSVGAALEVSRELFASP